MIEVKNLVKRYGDHYAVNHLSFTVEDGQIFGFLGPNGAGKSTTMNIMTGYLAATEGQVLVEGHDILEEPEAARACIGYLPEIPPLYPDMTVEEYLRFCAELKKIPKEQRTDQLTKVLALTHLEDMSARLIRNLSKGYRQRVGLAGLPQDHHSGRAHRGPGSQAGGGDPGSHSASGKGPHRDPQLPYPL